MRGVARQAATVLEMIKFQHTVFALPFALTGMILAARGLPPLRTIWWILAACVCARTAAMSFNRWADAELDARNPRTAIRAIPSGQLSRGFVLVFAVVSAALFVLCAAFINRLALLLSPVALVVLLGYSYTKRFTSLAHFVLGLALGIAPIGAWIAVRGRLDAVPLLLGLAVMLWTAGFDFIYACQDYEVDKREGLRSIPVTLGISGALAFSNLLHVLSIAALCAVGWLGQLHSVYFLGVAVVAGLLVWEHLLVNPRDLSRIDVAFFTVNSWVGVAIFAFTSLDLYLHI